MDHRVPGTIVYRERSVGVVSKLSPSQKLGGACRCQGHGPCDNCSVHLPQRVTIYDPRDLTDSQASQPHLEDGTTYRALRPTVVEWNLL